MTTAPKVCDNAAVYMLIQQPSDGRWLTFDRVKPPWGVAGPAGHIDEHGDPVDAMYAETEEEVGLKVTDYQLLVFDSWRDNTCRRLPGPEGVGHKSYLYEVEVTGTPRPAAEETAKLRWRTNTELQALANRTVDYAHGRISNADFKASLGMEPVWVEWFRVAGAITVTPEEAAVVDRLAATRYWEEA
ncbi:NUDIX hydrolase [Microbispora sp. NPDC049125]|uniref:NUDIX hydrolase n=1 Tax=Microbispora sp. NPDC049125 TaxID=3154929 RepID=UPI003467BD98